MAKLKFTIKKSSDDQFVFNLWSGDDSILRSETYKSKENCKNGIESVKKNSVEEKRYELKNSTNGKFFFNLKATNGQIVGTSPMFDTEADRKSAMQSVMKNAGAASVDDLT